MSRGHVFSVRLDDPENDRLNQLAEVYELDKSAVIRQLIATAPLLSIRFQELAVTTAPATACTCCKVHLPGGPA